METFGELLRRHRLAAVLTQDRLAERAGISATGIAAIEAGRRRAPRATTIARLLDALELDDVARAGLVAAATGRADPVTPASAPVGTNGGGSGPPPPIPAVVPQHDLPGVTRRFAFVGRPAELEQLARAWHDRTRVVLITGEAGAGKTRLTAEFIRSIRPAPNVLWGRCTEDRLGAYEAFVEPVRALVGAANPGDARAELARLVPELSAAQGWAGGPSLAEPDVEQRLLFDAVIRLIAGAGPTLLVLDDLHWADAASLSLLAALAASPLLTDLVVVGTVRSTDQTPATAGALAALRRTARLERIGLGGLRDADVARLIEEVAGEAVPPSLVATVAQATDGNPLFVEELTEHLLATGSAGGAAPAVPISLRETIVRRLDTLSPDARTLLRSGAVLGRVFDIDLAGRIADLDRDRVLSAGDDALLSGLVNEQSAVRLSFSHGLVQAAVYESASARRRLELHRRAAVELEDAYGATGAGDPVVFDIARHWAIVASADAAAAPAAARWAVRSGDAAAAAADIDEAIVRYRLAGQLWSAGTGEHAATLIRLGRALSAAGRTTEADDHFRQARHLAEALGDVSLFAQAAVGLAATVRYGHSDPERIEALERSIDLLAPDQRVLRTTAAAMLKRQLGFDFSEDAYQKRQRAARLVLDVVAGDELEPELLLALGAARDSIVVDDPVVLDRLSRQIVEVASSPRNLAVLANAWYGRAWAALELGDGTGWNASIAAFSAIAEELRLPFESALAATMATTSALIEGRYEEGEAQSQRALALGIEGGDPNASAVHLTGAVMRGLDLGHAGAMVGLMSDMRDELADVPTFVAGWAMTAAVAGERALASSLLDEQAAVGFDRVRRDLEWLPVIGFFCHACAGLDAIEHAPALYELLLASPARTIRVGPLAGWWGPTDHHLGALCRVMGRWEEAEARLRSALVVCDQLAARPWRARSEVELARVLERRGSATVDERELLRADALAIAHELGAAGIAALLA